MSYSDFFLLAFHFYRMCYTIKHAQNTYDNPSYAFNPDHHWLQ